MTTPESQTENVKPVELIDPEELPPRTISKMEHFLGPEPYRILRGLLNTPASRVGMILILFFVIVAVFAPMIAPPYQGRDPFKIPRDGFSPDPKPMGTVWKVRPIPTPFWWKMFNGDAKFTHVWGTSSGQYDIFYGVIWGTRSAFRAGLIITFAALVIGLLIGSIAAYYGGIIDNVLMRIVDIFMTLPYIMAALILTAVLTPKIGRSVVPAMIAMIVFGWMTYARLIRSDILSVRERDYILAARVVGVKDGQIVSRHIIPNAIFPTLVIASMDIGTYVLAFAALSFLGVGTEVGYADWGQLMSFARDWITNLGQYWYIVVFPGLALVLFVLGWNLVGDALRDVLDPKMRSAK